MGAYFLLPFLFSSFFSIMSKSSCTSLASTFAYR